MSWRYGIFRDLYAMDIRGNLPVFIKKFLNHRSFQLCVQISFEDLGSSAPWWVEAYWDEHKKTLMEPSRKSPSVEHHSLEFCDSFRFFIVKTPKTFTNISPFLIEKAFTSSIGEVKSIRKMRSEDLFLEVSSAKQATTLINLQKLAHLDVTVTPHTNLNFSGGVISPADFSKRVD
ncbi:uncharacterized protein TNCV_3919541 [Trichonephila clavipes]|nr:uncharacterized protein TNCV_3919541 [Trichonephila clavipes]